jgi:hypothetical protein
MFNFQDLGSLSKLARVLIWPLFAAATYASFGVFAVDKLPAKSSFWYEPMFALAFIGQAIICTVIVEIVDYLMYMIDSLSNPWLQPIVGMVLLTIGLLPLNSIANPESEIFISPLWAFLCLAWGLRIYT